jgi:hypothetical protein
MSEYQRTKWNKEPIIPQQVTSPKPSVLDCKPTIFDETFVSKQMTDGAIFNSIQNAVINFMPKETGLLAARLNVGMKPGGKVFIRPDLIALENFLPLYGFRKVSEENKEGYLVYVR